MRGKSSSPVSFWLSSFRFYIIIKASWCVGGDSSCFGLFVSRTPPPCNAVVLQKKQQQISVSAAPCWVSWFPHVRVLILHPCHSLDRTCGSRGRRTRRPTNFLASCAGLKSSQSPQWVRGPACQAGLLIRWGSAALLGGNRYDLST